MKLGSKVSKILKHMEIADPKAFLGAHTQAWDLVNALFKEEEERVSKEIYGEVDYQSHNWKYLKADQAGQLRLIKQLQNLFKD